MSLHAKLIEVAAAVGWVDKAGWNKDQGYGYVQAVDIFAKVRPQLIERKILFTVGINALRTEPTPSGKQLLTTIEGDFSLVDTETGEVLSLPFCGTGADFGDKGLFKAITGAIKYFFISLLLLPTGDDPEKDDAVPRATAVSRNAEQAPSSHGSRETNASTPKAPAATKVTASAGLSAAQKAQYAIFLREHGITGNQRKAFSFSATGKGSTLQMTNDDYDKILAIFGVEETLAVHIANAQMVAP